MKICLCGSTRFMDQFNAVNQLLTLQGHIVYSVAYASSQHRNDGITDEQKIALDLVHLRKIMESDAIVVVGLQENGSMYIGDSTRREIMWANLWNKSTHFWDKEVSDWFQTFYAPLRDAAKSIEEASMSKTQRDEAVKKIQEDEFGAAFDGTKVVS
jgi:hypothetical protein